jgi:hypothetical protein
MTDAPRIELRFSLDPETLLGRPKAALLQAIDETGSIAAAGRRNGDELQARLVTALRAEPGCRLEETVLLTTNVSLRRVSDTRKIV